MNSKDIIAKSRTESDIFALKCMKFCFIFAIIDFFIVELNKQWKADAGDWLIAVSGIAALIPIFTINFQKKSKFCCCFADFSRTYFHWIIYKLMGLCRTRAYISFCYRSIALRLKNF